MRSPAPHPVPAEGEPDRSSGLGVPPPDPAMAATGGPGDQPDHVARRTNRLLSALLLIMVGAVFYVAAAFFMPLVLALLLAMTLAPLVRFLHRRGLGEGLASGLVVLVLALGVVGVVGALSTPFVQLVDEAPQLVRQVQTRFEEFRKPMETVSDVADQVNKATGGDGGVQQVVVQQPGILSQVAGSALSIVTTTAIVIVLTLFLLANGDHFSMQIVKSFGRLADKKRALGTVRDVEEKISRYLLTITAINAGLGVAVGLAMWALGMPTPLLWGVMAALVNFLPYVGSLVGIAVVGMVALVQFPSIGLAILPPLAYFACTAIEGQFVTPTIVGRRLQLNTAAVFIAIAFWSFLWSIPGALMAVPILVVLKVLCENVDGLSGLGRFLSAEVEEEEA